MAYPRFQKARDFKFARRTSGNLALNSVNWANVDTGLDLTLNSVSVGDVVEYQLAVLVNNEAVSLYMDVATIVSSNPVNQFGNRGAVDNAHEGWPGWYAGSSNILPLGSAAWYTLQAGDISSGSVTLRLRFRSTGSKTVFANATHPLDVFARNLGPVDPN